MTSTRNTGPKTATASRYCNLHHCLRADCPGYTTHSYAVRLQKSLVDEIEVVMGPSGYLDLSDFIRQAVEKLVAETAAQGPGSAAVSARTDAAVAGAELAEMKRRLRWAVSSLNSILDGEEPAPADDIRKAVVAGLAARTEQIAPGSVKFREP